jgi:hypothetical protein
VWLLNQTGEPRFARLVSIVSLAAFLLLAPQALAGPSVRSVTTLTPRVQSVPTPVAPVVRYSVTISVVVPTPPLPAMESASVILVGPDGQKRSFPVEGGLASIQYRRVVLRPGETVVINLPVAK